MTHFNTTHESGKTLKKYDQKAKTQEQKVLDLFKKHDFDLRPSIVHRLLYGNGMDYYKNALTSTRRAITNLASDGKLIKTNKKAVSPFGRPEYFWKLT